MSALFYALGIFVLFFAMIYGNYGRFAVSVVRYSKKPVKRRVRGKVVTTYPKVPVSEQISCYVPIWQTVVVRRTLHNRAGYSAPLAIMSICLIMFNMFISFVWAPNGYVLFAAHICMYIGILLHIILYGIVTADAVNIYGFSNFVTFLNFIAPHLACTIAYSKIPTIMSDMFKAKTFEENDGEVVIKSKSNK